MLINSGISPFNHSQNAYSSNMQTTSVPQINQHTSKKLTFTSTSNNNNNNNINNNNTTSINKLETITNNNNNNNIRNK